MKHGPLPRPDLTDARSVVPEDPRDAGFRPVVLELEQLEPAHLLANEARLELRQRGFTDDEIDNWAREFLAHRDTATGDDLAAWIHVAESTTPPEPTS